MIKSYPFRVCSDCNAVLANGNDGISYMNGIEARHFLQRFSAGVEQQTRDNGGTIVATGEDLGFSRSPCLLCRSTLAGDRHVAALLCEEPDTEPEPPASGFPPAPGFTFYAAFDMIASAATSADPCQATHRVTTKGGAHRGYLVDTREDPDYDPTSAVESWRDATPSGYLGAAPTVADALSLFPDAATVGAML